MKYVYEVHRAGIATRVRVHLVDEALERLARLAALIRDSPCVGRPAGMRASVEPAEALLDALCHVADYDFDLHIPTKAVIGQGYLVAKINFFKAALYAIDGIPGAERFRDRLEFEVGQSIYSKLAEELFISIVTDRDVVEHVKLTASRLLLRIWEERLLTEVDDFAPLLESAWHARTRVRPVLGTLLGTQEVFRLFQEASDERLLEYFGREDVPEEEIAAFEEYVFGLSSEQITELRAWLVDKRLSVVSLDDARRLLGVRADTWSVTDDRAEAIYTSYKRRRLNASHRALIGALGPKKTAEEYVMAALLRGGFQG